MTLLCILVLNLALADDKKCGDIQSGRDAIRAFQTTGNTSGFPFVWFNWKRCRDKMGIAEFEYTEMSEREYRSRRDGVLNQVDSVSEAELRLSELAEFFPDKHDLDGLRDRIVADAEKRGLEKTKAINSLPRCAAKDFSPRMPDNWDQKSTNLCYAHAAAAAASFELGVEVSVPDVVSSYLTPGVLGKIKRDTDASPPTVLKEVRQRESDSRLRRVSETGNLFDPELGGGYQSIALAEAAKVGFCRASEWRNQPARSNESPDTFDLMQKLPSRFRLINSESEWAPYRKVFPHLTFADYQRIAARSRADTVVRDLGRAACKDRLPLSLEVRKENPKGPLNVAQIIQNQLLKDHVVPVGNFAHAFMVVGQRLSKDGICLFKLRDTSGDGCAMYESFVGAIKGSCSNGYFEVTAIAPNGHSPLAATVTVYTKRGEQTKSTGTPTGSSR